MSLGWGKGTVNEMLMSLPEYTALFLIRTMFLVAALNDLYFYFVIFYVTYHIYLIVGGANRTLCAFGENHNPKCTMDPPVIALAQ